MEWIFQNSWVVGIPGLFLLYFSFLWYISEKGPFPRHYCEICGIPKEEKPLLEIGGQLLCISCTLRKILQEGEPE